MKRKFLSVIIISILFLAIGLTLNTYAASGTFTIKLEPNKTEIKQGETVTINLYIDNINVPSGELGIGAFTAKLVYDTTIFGSATSNGSSSWDNPSLQANGQMAGVRSDGIVAKSRQLVGSITLTAKQDATIGGTTISITNLQGANGNISDTAVIGTNSQASISIINPVTPDPVTPNVPAPSPVSNQTKQNTTKSNTTTQNQTAPDLQDVEEEATIEELIEPAVLEDIVETTTNDENIVNNDVNESKPLVVICIVLTAICIILVAICIVLCSVMHKRHKN